MKRNFVGEENITKMNRWISRWSVVTFITGILVLAVFVFHYFGIIPYDWGFYPELLMLFVFLGSLIIGINLRLQRAEERIVKLEQALARERKETQNP